MAERDGNEQHDRAAIIERIRQLWKQIAAAQSPADIPQEIIDEATSLRKTLIEMLLADRPSFELAEFANKLKARQGTKMLDFKALYEQIEAMDKELMSDE